MSKISQPLRRRSRRHSRLVGFVVLSICLAGARPATSQTSPSDLVDLGRAELLQIQVAASPSRPARPGSELPYPVAEGVNT